MANVDLSIIIPSKNNKSKIAAIIKKLAAETENLDIEFIVIDMNSSDGGVLEALNVIKDSGIRGCVIQSGGSTVSSALNTGIYKASGKYITFVYPSRLYKDYFTDYFSAAEERKADFIFAAPETKDGNRILVSDNVSGTDVLVSLVKSSIVMAFTAVMFDREFLVRNGIRFYEECTLGYAEAFIYNVLLHSPKVAYSKTKLERDHLNGLEKNDAISASNNCFERLDAMVKVFSAAKELHKDDKVLLNTLEYNELPAVAMGCVDKLLDEGFKYSSIKKLLKSKKYDSYIEFSMDTPASLRNKIIIWKTLPWFYKP